MFDKLSLSLITYLIKFFFSSLEMIDEGLQPYLTASLHVLSVTCFQSAVYLA